MNYRDILTSFWTNWRPEKTNFSNIGKWWDFGKTQIKQLTISYSSRVAKEK